MAAVEFILGLTVGISIYVWQQYRFKQQLKKTLNLFAIDADKEVSLPIHSLIRRELSELYHHRQKLETERQTWQELIEQAPVGYLQVDADNQLLGCNDQAKQLLKIDPHRTQRVRLILELVRSYDLDRLIEQTRKSQQNQTKEWVFYYTRYVAPNVDDNQSIHPANSLDSFSKIVESIALTGYGIPLPNSQVGVFLVNRQSLVELSQSRDRTFADLTHELRTPLTSISLVAENLERRLQEPERRWVEQMLQETNRLIELVQEWLDLTQLEASSARSLNYETIDLHELVFSVWQTLEPIASKKQVTLAYCGAESVIIEADRSRLIQVFLNLLDNAIKHNCIEGQIIVRIMPQTPELAEAPNSIMIDVIDSGTGFTKADLPYIFERLYRGDKSRTREQQNIGSTADGSGLGLAIVEQIIRAHGGSISAKNHLEIGGAWLQITLPATKAKSK